MSTRENVLENRVLKHSSFFSANYLLGSVQILIPLGAVFIFVALLAISLLVIIIYRIFFLNRVQFYGDVKEFFNTRLNNNTNRAKTRSKKDKKNAMKEGERAEPVAEETKRDDLGATTVMVQSSFALTSDVAEEDLMTDFEQVVEEVMHKNVWCSAFENILADTTNNLRNMRALHSILTTPLNFDLGIPERNRELEKDHARLAVAIRRREHLASRGILPYLTSSSQFKENILTSRPGARAITTQLEALETMRCRPQMGVGSDQSRSLTRQEQTNVHYDGNSPEDSFLDTESYRDAATLMATNDEPGLHLTQLVQAVTNLSIADRNLMLTQLR